MKEENVIKIRAGDLKPVLPGLAKVTGGKGTLPVLQCVRFELVNRKAARLIATELDLTLSLNVPAEVRGKPEPFLVPIARLREQAKAAKVRDTILLASVRDAPPAEEFPVPASFRAAPIPLPNTAVTGLLRAFACASREESRYVLRGAYLDVGGKAGKGGNADRIVATDGRHLFSSNSLTLPKLRRPIILPDHTLWTWKGIAESWPWTLRLSAATGKNGIGVPAFRIDGPSWTITGRCIDGNFPNYRQVIPPDGEFKTHVELPEAAVAELAKAIPSLPGKKLSNRPIGLRIEKDRVALLVRETQDEAWQPHSALTAGAKVKGPKVTVFVNRDYLQKAFRFGLNRIDVIDELAPLRLSRDGDLMIVMPVRVPGQPHVNRPATPIRQPRSQPKSKPESNTNPRKPMVTNRSNHNGGSPSSEPDPIDTAAAQLGEVREALKTAAQGLTAANNALKAARQQQRQTAREIRTVKSTLRSLKKVDL